MIILSFSNTRKFEITECEWKDLQVAIRNGQTQYGCFDGARFQPEDTRITLKKHDEGPKAKG